MADVGYSGTPLPKKLGLKSGMTVTVLGAPGEYRAVVKPFPSGSVLRSRLTAKQSQDCVHLFVRTKAELRRLIGRAKASIKANGMIWVSWPKQTSREPTDLTGNVVREIGLATGLVDVKVCAVDETWSGLKFVIPVKSRAQKGGVS
jgi:hypothetical protein